VRRIGGNLIFPRSKRIRIEDRRSIVLRAAISCTGIRLPPRILLICMNIRL